MTPFQFLCIGIIIVCLWYSLSVLRARTKHGPKRLSRKERREYNKKLKAIHEAQIKQSGDLYDLFINGVKYGDESIGGDFEPGLLSDKWSREE